MASRTSRSGWRRSWRRSGIPVGIVDAGPLYAAIDGSARSHAVAREVLERQDLHLVVPALVVAEVTYFVGRRIGPGAEARFLRGLQMLDVEAPSVGDWVRIADLVEQYADFPLGGTDASVVALAERLDADVVITFDRRHFGAIRPRHRSALRLLPD